VSEPIIVEPIANEPIYIEPLVSSAPAVVAIASSPGPFGPVSLAKTTIAVTIDGQGTVLTPGVKADLPTPFNGRITGWQLIGDLNGNAVVDILVGDPVNDVPYSSITGGNEPELTAVDAAVGDALGWNAQISEGDVLRYQLVTVDTIRRLTIALFVERD
jgi:hypothetical protein